MNFFKLSLTGMIIRFYLVMLVVFIAGFSGIWPIAFLALPIFLSGMIGLTLGSSTVNRVLGLDENNEH